MEAIANPDLMRALGRLVRGLSALFWGLPITLIVCFHTGRADFLHLYNLVPPLACTGLLLYGLILLGSFQQQERVWRNALDVTRILAIINLGLSPFLFFWNKMPGNHLFSLMVILLSVCGLLFLASLNWVIRRLGAMLPDEALRVETRQFTSLNLNLLAATVILTISYLVLSQVIKPPFPFFMNAYLAVLDELSLWLLVLLLLLPMAMTMALLWKIKEVILDNVFGPCTTSPG